MTLVAELLTNQKAWIFVTHTGGEKAYSSGWIETLLLTKKVWVKSVANISRDLTIADVHGIEVWYLLHTLRQMCQCKWQMPWRTILLQRKGWMVQAPSDGSKEWLKWAALPLASSDDSKAKIWGDQGWLLSASPPVTQLLRATAQCAPSNNALRHLLLTFLKLQPAVWYTEHFKEDGRRMDECRRRTS